MVYDVSTLHVAYTSVANQLSVFILFSISECTKTDNRSAADMEPISNTKTSQNISDEVTELAKEDVWRQDFREEIVEIDAMVEIEVKAA